jgi:hypothetical protein
MLDAKKRLVALAVIAGVGLSGCDLSQKDPNFPDSVAPTTFNALFSLAPDPVVPNVPYPFDLWFATTKDMTIDIPVALTSTSLPLFVHGTALNTLDGWSTTGSMTATFNQEIDPASLRGSTVRVVEIYNSNFGIAPAGAAELPPGATSPVRRVLQYDTDYVASVSDDVDSGGKILKITPIKPLEPSTSTTHIGYVVYLTNGIEDLKGNPAAPSDTYAAIKAAPAGCGTISDATTKAICQLTQVHLAIGKAVGIDPANVVLSWSFSTQSVEPTFEWVAKTVAGRAVSARPMGISTQAVGGLGKANIYVGTTVLPYYSAVPANVNDATILSKFWTAAGPPPAPLDQTSRWVTRFNPVPAKTADVTVPVLVSVPNATAAGGACSKPAAGWPVAIVEHGLRGDRRTMLRIADNFADVCFVVAAIDAPMHGITNKADPFYCPTNPLCSTAQERTFNVDFVNNATNALTPDGIPDGSGTWIFYVGNLLYTRDSWRQAEADMIVFTKSVANLDFTGDGVADVNPNRIHYVGISLSGILGGSHIHFAGDTQTATLSVPGGPLSQVALQSRGLPFYNQVAGLLVPGSTLFNKFFNEGQAILDSADPANHIFDAQRVVPLHLQKVVGDTVIPNATTDYLIRAGNLKKISTLGPTAVGEGSGGFTTMTAGDHGSLMDPTASLAATIEMQTQAVKFAASATQPGGPFVVITNPAVVEQ